MYQTVISAALLTLYKRKGPESLGFRANVLDVVREVRDASIHVGGIRIRRTPYGSHSDEVSQFIGRLAMGGYLVQESPMRLTNEGLKLLRTHLVDELETQDAEDTVRMVELLHLQDELRSTGEPATT